MTPAVDERESGNRRDANKDCGNSRGEEGSLRGGDAGLLEEERGILRATSVAYQEET
jgi:hypothetical protein